ncbi:hypothetical protein CRG98_037331 [Punica granatum]|uniref:Stress-associated endoplasmic reticulum protein 2-like n=2 Tax=Punica granatum TaxID=22663 RepID=A0A2I0IF20_PUNGR|nr:hypothetical protein CRG98_037331 [Punica granatum]
MTTSRRLADRKVERFEKNITKRGTVPETTVKKGKDYPVGPILLGFFIFVVIGSSLFQIIRTATTGGMAFQLRAYDRASHCMIAVVDTDPKFHCYLSSYLPLLVSLSTLGVVVARCSSQDPTSEAPLASKATGDVA